MRYFLDIAYRGTAYNGWQVQENTTQTVQGFLNRALRNTLREETETVAGGRTDAGVHCKRQFVHFDTAYTLDRNAFLYKLNRCLPEDIYVSDVLPVQPTAHARFDALSRSYEYHISLEKNPFLEGLAVRYWFPLDIDLMNETAAKLFLYNDFEAFSKTHTDVKTFLCDIYRAEWIRQGNDLVFYIRANRFLRGMVRTLVGTLLEVGRGKLTTEGFEAIIQSKKRTAAGKSAPPQGLFLTDVSYPTTVFL
ncbi:MAG: tRNA pseudouridine(38-40) synthase TruA [Thermoflexibacteraceae bacterium]|jgi:tRNA pseudouridine38-40 synthase